MAVGRWLYDNPHTQYTLTNAVAAVYMTDWALKYDWRRRLSHMQMTDSDFTQNDWRRPLLATGVRSGAICYNLFTANLPGNLLVKKIVNRQYGNEFVASLFGPPCSWLRSYPPHSQ